MNLALEINSVDRTDLIERESIKKSDYLNERVNTLRFRTLKYGSRGFTPEINQTVEMTIDAVKEFGGIITSVDKSIRDGGVIRYNVNCIDYTQLLNRRIVLERYEDKTVAEIITAVIDKYATDFTYTNVNCDVLFDTMAFNRTTVSACLDKLARESGYSWYVDYNKDIHFFPRNENPAPFEITDTNGNYLQNTLEITDDLSQIRNTVFIRGAEERGVVRTEEYVADGEQTNLSLASKFAELPTVTVATVSKTVGVDYVHNEDDYECFWNFEQKYIRFKDATKPTNGQKVEITGIPLFPIIIRIFSPPSVAEYGTYEFFKEDKTIKSRQEALKYAQAQLEAYKDGVIEGGFATNQSGLRSGQLIRINSSLMGVDETFLIQRVSFSMISKEAGQWDVKLATLRTVGIIQVLQDLIRYREVREFDPDQLLTYIDILDSCGATDSIDAITTFDTGDYYWADVGIGQQEGFWNLATWGDNT